MPASIIASIVIFGGVLIYSLASFVINRSRKAFSAARKRREDEHQQQREAASRVVIEEFGPDGRYFRRTGSIGKDVIQEIFEQHREPGSNVLYVLITITGGSAISPVFTARYVTKNKEGYRGQVSKLEIRLKSHHPFLIFSAFHDFLGQFFRQGR
jgi:hypothetical protein